MRRNKRASPIKASRTKSQLQAIAKSKSLIVIKFKRSKRTSKFLKARLRESTRQLLKGVITSNYRSSSFSQVQAKA